VATSSHRGLKSQAGNAGNEVYSGEKSGEKTRRKIPVFKT
jgi:hypothetical protein